MTAHIERYPDWKAPGEDGALLIWPEPGQLLEETRANGRRMSRAQTLVQGVPLSELRRRQRQWLGHAGDELVIATGHQTELYHPGVWAKDVLINAVAAKLAGAAWHLAVDTDAPKHLHIRWPHYSEPITDDPALTSAPWSGLLRGPSTLHLEVLASALHEAAREWPFEPLAGRFLELLKSVGAQTPDLARAITEGMRRLDGELGLTQRALVTSPMWLSPPYLVYVHHILARAGEFAAGYNRALANYRLAHGIRTPARPWPDLRVEGELCEAPFWLDCAAQAKRLRATMRQRGGAWMLEAEGDEFAFIERADGWEAAARLQQFLQAHGLTLAPRALTLTMFFRLLLVDQFVHGIGGGRYDQVTDDVIRAHFGLEPPKFSVTTATLYFPPAAGRARINLLPLMQEGRRLRHGMLSREKMDTVRRIDALPRRSAERQRLFYEMHVKLANALNMPAMRDWEQRVEEMQRLAVEQAPIFDRELFYAIQPEVRLRGLIEAYGKRVGV